MIPCSGFGIGNDGSITPYTLKDNAAGATMTFLAANANKRHRVHGVTVATNIAGTYTLSIGSVVIQEFYLGANSGYGQIFVPLYYDNGVNNEAVTLAKPAGAICTATVWASSV